MTLEPEPRAVRVKPPDPPHTATAYGPEERYRIYAQRGGDLHLLATTATPAGVGVCLVQLHDDAKDVGRRLSDEGVIGVIDGDTHDWIINPFPRRTA